MSDLQINIDFVNDKKGKTKAVQIPLEDWEKVLRRLKRLEQNEEIKTSIEVALKEVKMMQEGKKDKNGTNHSFGKWVGKETPEEIISQLKKSRKFNRKTNSL